MTLGAVDLLFNIVVMLFWIRAWESGRQMALSDNPYLAGIRSITQPVLELPTRLLPWHSTRPTAWCCWLGLIVFRGLVLPMANPDAFRMWQVTWGFMVFTPHAAPEWLAAYGIIFSLASFAAFLFQVWIVALLYSSVRQPERPAEFLQAIAAPWPRYAAFGRALIIVGAGAATVGLLYFAAGGPSPQEPSFLARPIWWIVRELVNGLASAANVLIALRSLMIVVLIGTWVALFGGSESMLEVCREWLDFLLWPFRRFQLQVAMFDLTPIIAYIALGLAHYIIYNYILRMIFFVFINH
jgi:uncharacterized protein YggT (Ycf19 family)